MKTGKDHALEAKADKLLAPQAPNPTQMLAAISAAIAMQSAWHQATQQSFEKFAIAGRLLAQQKAALEHGEWLPWLHAHIPDTYRQREKKNAPEAWERTARNWMRIAEILDHCHPEAIEAAQTVSQLFRLAQFLPEGLPAPGESSGEPDPPEVLARIKRWVTANSALLTVERVRSFPPDIRQALRDQIAPIWEALEA